MQTCKITPNSLRTIDEYKYNINPNFDLKAITPLVMINDNESLINEGNDVANIFPIEAFPVFFKKIITECNTASNYPCDYTGASLLAAISAAVGKTAILKVKNGWNEYAALYLAIVGNPGAIKSHPLDFAFKPFEEIDNEAIRKFKNEINQYNELINHSKKDKSHNGFPQKPILKKTILHNFTPEVLHQRLAENEIGCYVVNDELATFLDNMNNYSKGDQASIYLQFWSNKVTSIDRISKDVPLWLPQPFLGIIGTLQPHVIQKLFPKEKTNNGFLQRFLFAFPTNSEKLPLSDNEFPLDLESSYIQWIKQYRQSNPIEFDNITGKPNPKIYNWSNPAKDYFYQWQRENTIKVNQAGDTLESEILTKFDNHFIRLSLLMQIMIDYNTNQISIQAVQNAAKLCKYFEKCSLKVLDILENGNQVNSLSVKKTNFYNSLPVNVTTSEANDIGVNFGFNTKAVQRFLSDKNFFIKVAHGNYSKTIIQKYI